MGTYLDVSTDERGVATITLHHGKVNALCVGLLDELRDAADALATDPAVRVVVVTGGAKLLAAGADIGEFAADADPASFRIAPSDEVRRIGGAFLEALGALAGLPQPTIASVSGYALGGGCELALACDLRIASTNARFGLPEILLGIIPGGGGTQRLARLVGPAVAKELIFTGRMVDAAEALRIGLVNRVVEAEELDGATDELAGTLAAGPRASLAIAKRAIDQGLAGPLEAGLRLEQDAFVEVFATDEATIGVRSFLEHGPGKADFR
jgi:enoyl-CoA hydratase/carnithine racemase